MMRGHRGFTLLEMIIVLVLMGIASAAVVGMVAQVGSGQTENSELKVGAQLLQECGEWIIANHRRDENFYPNVLVPGTSANCFSGPGAYGGFNAATVTVTDISSISPCTDLTPSGAECKNVAISVSNGSVTLNTLNLTVVRYN
jgi:prepilin-type N-terminal cleavage/methylation domain-containing protein